MKATILIPTTGDRYDILQYAVRSVLNQTETRFELFVVGDGVEEATRARMPRLLESDRRIRFFDHPKHSRRGEPYRDRLLKEEASGEIVGYLCDRDLWMPGHLATHLGVLKDYDFCATQSLWVHPDQTIEVRRRRCLGDLRGIPLTEAGISWHPLSTVCHRLDFYKRLPFGWRTTPEGQYTDIYMWEQCLAQPGCRAYLDTVPTVFYFKRGEKHPGWPVSARVDELAHWSRKLERPEDLLIVLQTTLSTVIRERNQWKRKYSAAEERLRGRLLIMGKGPRTWLKEFFCRLKNGKSGD
ncbi:MAG: glycosyltransferase family A protein [Puniceicoccaceae bacterium]